MYRFSYILYIGILAFVCHTLQAQIGVRGSLNMATFAFDEEDVDGEVNYKAGFGLGVFYQVRSGSFTFQPEVQIIQQGISYSSEFNGQETTESLTLNYIQIPLMAKYAFGNLESTNFFIQMGPYIGRGIGKVINKGCLGDDCETEELEYDSEGDEGPKPMDFGLNIGVGINFNKNIGLDLRYGLGLNNLSEDDDSVTNRAINLGFSYSF